MCPDRQILSVYLDRELPSPWKEKMDRHLAVCPSCRAALARLEDISAALRAGAGAGETAAEGMPLRVIRERVWQNISVPRSIQGGTSRLLAYEPRIWRRTVTIPLPALAAAAVLLFILSFVLINRPAGTVNPQDSAISAGLGPEVQNLVPVSDMNGVLQYLGKEEPGDIMIIRLPETRSFMNAGEPTIIRAADYLRRASSP
jgi:hypothetical protein